MIMPFLAVVVPFVRRDVHAVLLTVVVFGKGGKRKDCRGDCPEGE
jgi:hypothetical protein